MIDYITQNPQAIADIVAYTIALAAAIAAVTPTDSDNKIINKVRKIANALGLNVGSAKNLIDD
ncbi:hypothetical protein SLPG_00043 [Salicola phage CGphi29]|uniref:hypothetical protein n=1 Tax=Salicola phage CGphi29 TaxID=754067 RepID=UPI0002C094E1|nr:hypothetical protein SLPG_00043 [Salicola phage CGphi29]AGH31837.1 hypothetical protein SLPG_00043 [Salicola phage CGphi29]